MTLLGLVYPVRSREDPVRYGEDPIRSGADLVRSTTFGNHSIYEGHSLSLLVVSVNKVSCLSYVSGSLPLL